MDRVKEKAGGRLTTGFTNKKFMFFQPSDQNNQTPHPYVSPTSVPGSAFRYNQPQTHITNNHFHMIYALIPAIIGTGFKHNISGINFHFVHVVLAQSAFYHLLFAHTPLCHLCCRRCIFCIAKLHTIIRLSCICTKPCQLPSYGFWKPQTLHSQTHNPPLLP